MRRSLAALLVLSSAACGRSGVAPSSPPTVPAPQFFDPRVADPRTENLVAWTKLQADLPAVADAQARVDAFWSELAARGGAPAHGGGTIAFVLRSPDDGWTVAGTFNGWDPNATPLVRIPGTDTLAAVVSAGDTRVSYKFVRAGAWSRDPDARWVEWDGIDTGTVGNFNSVTFGDATAPMRASELRLFASFPAHALGNARDVFVQVPSTYWPDRAPLPLLVCHDGNESITRGQFDTTLDTARAAGTIPPLLVAYVALADQADRMAEYTFDTDGARGLLYESFIADELVPAMEAAFSTPRTPDARGVIGASLGGLISWKIGLDRPDVFARVGGQSSSFFWNSNDLITEFQNAAPLPGRWYLDAGADADNGDVTLQMDQVVSTKGYDADYVRQMDGQHDWPWWQQRLPGAVGFLFNP